MSSVVSVFGVEPVRIGGTETFARELSLQLHEQGFQSVLCFLSEPTDEVREFLNAPNVSLEVLDKVTHLDWSAIRRLSKIIRRHNAEILHLHFTGFLSIYPWLARLLSVKRVFFTDHSSRPFGYSPRRARFWKRALARTLNWPITKAISVSRYGERCLTALDLLPRNRHELIYNAVDLTRVNSDDLRGREFRKRYEIPEDRTVIVQVSWMIPEKGISELLEVAAQLVLDQANVHLVFVGEGEYREQFMQKAQTLGLGHKITWTGLIADPFSAGVFDAADIICQLSAWEELFGWMIAEAMAHGKPVVATKVGGIPELVDDGVSGFLVSRGDGPATVNALNKLISNRDLREQMGAVGASIVREKFDLKRNVAQLVNLYDMARSERVSLMQSSHLEHQTE